VEDDSDGSDELANRDFSRYKGYWHGFTFIIFDSKAPDGAWIRSTRWVPVAARSDDPSEEREQ
jgi:hypothetical protein